MSYSALRHGPTSIAQVSARTILPPAAPQTVQVQVPAGMMPGQFSQQTP